MSEPKVIELEQDEEVYTLTPLGFFSIYIQDEKLSKQIVDGLELYLRRHNLGMAIDDNRLKFVELFKGE